MSIQIIDNFELSLAKPIDNRFVVGSLSFYTNKDSIPLKYNGLRIYDTTDNTPYIWTGATWSYDIDRVSITLDNTTNSSHYITFVGATSGVNYVKTSDKGLKYNPLSSQVLLADGSVSLPTLSFSSSTNLGIYRVNSTTLGFASGGAKRFEISSTSATSSVPFSVSAISGLGSPAFRVASTPFGGSGGYQTGVMSIGYISSASNFEFFPFINTSSFAIATLSPVSSEGGSNTVAGTRLTFVNYANYSTYNVRNVHYFGTETNNGFISIGGSSPDQFQFHMSDRTSVLGGGGLAISRNLLVGGTASVSRIRLGDGSSTSLALSFTSATQSGFFFSPIIGFNPAYWEFRLANSTYLTLKESLMVGDPNIFLSKVTQGTSLILDTSRSYISPSGLASLSLQISESGTGLYSPSMGELAISVYDNGLGSGVEKLKFAVNDIYADIHNKGTSGIGDSGNNATPWSYPSIASGQLTLVTGDFTSATNCSSPTIKPCLWHRTGNTVTVSGQISFTISAPDVDSTFKLKIPIPSSFGVDSGGGNGNNWQLNGLGKIVGGVGTNSGNIATIQAYGTSTAQFKFYPSMTGAVTMVYHYTYTIGTWLSTSGGGGGLGLGL